MMDYDPKNRIRFSHLTNNALVYDYNYSNAKKEVLRKKLSMVSKKAAREAEGSIDVSSESEDGDDN